MRSLDGETPCYCRRLASWANACCEHMACSYVNRVWRAIVFVAAISVVVVAYTKVYEYQSMLIPFGIAAFVLCMGWFFGLIFGILMILFWPLLSAAAVADVVVHWRVLLRPHNRIVFYVLAGNAFAIAYIMAWCFLT